QPRCCLPAPDDIGSWSPAATIPQWPSRGCRATTSVVVAPSFARFEASANVSSRTTGRRKSSGKLHADVAQLVEHHLAKVDVASSSLVVRSGSSPSFLCGGISTVGWPRGEATDCKSVYTGSNPVPTSKKQLNMGDWRSGSALP